MHISYPLTLVLAALPLISAAPYPSLNKKSLDSTKDFASNNLPTHFVSKFKTSRAAEQMARNAIQRKRQLDQILGQLTGGTGGSAAGADLLGGLLGGGNGQGQAGQGAGGNPLGGLLGGNAQQGQAGGDPFDGLLGGNQGQDQAGAGGDLLGGLLGGNAGQSQAGASVATTTATQSSAVAATSAVAVGGNPGAANAGTAGTAAGAGTAGATTIAIPNANSTTAPAASNLPASCNAGAIQAAAAIPIAFQPDAAALGTPGAANAEPLAAAAPAAASPGAQLPSVTPETGNQLSTPPHPLPSLLITAFSKGECIGIEQQTPTTSGAQPGAAGNANVAGLSLGAELAGGGVSEDATVGGVVGGSDE
ncbi:hypothetical protein CC78DRAFT_577284 [Lojkania enalia]|uniref:Uncharacterized protein n=1 Tax=Lojkania enalia TaxID=147567 RepID=A0A9P4N8Z2_9PLEO|nr:hypothetical protein CC78DRAFT_577284 [Didymosphaeria enalia]